MGRHKNIPRLRGLSPRVRGNLYTPVYLMLKMRSIPACAGEPIILLK